MFGFGIFDVFLVAVGYVGSIYSWPYIRTAVTGVEAEVANLKARITALKP